jgi:threonine synthase
VPTVAAWIPTEGVTGSALTHLEGSFTGTSLDADVLRSLDEAGKPLLARYDLALAAKTLTRSAVKRRRVGGLWRWREILPVRDWRYVATLGEGGTPLLLARRLGGAFGIPKLFLKCEGLNPTGSFKARGMAVAVSRAAELGATHLVAPSAGNAAGAMAAYAAAAGVRATVIMPADAPRANKVEVLIAGATLVLVDGLISDCGRLAKRIADELDAFDLSTLKEPYRVEGKKTMALEIAEDFEWQLPEAIVYPTGGGTGIVGLWKGLAELEQMGFIGPDRPRIYCVQAEGCAPIVAAFKRGERFATPVERASTRAAGIRVPSAVGDFLVLDAIYASHGAAVAVPENEIENTQRFAAEKGAGYLSLETAAALSALPALRELKLIGKQERIVVFDTGAGYKSEEPRLLDFPAPISANASAWDATISRLTSASDNLQTAHRHQ